MEIAHLRGSRRVAAHIALLAGFGLAPSAPAIGSPATPPTPLEALVAEALARNPEIRAARLDHEAALARRAPARALDDPMLEAGVVNAALPFSLRRDDMTMQMLGLSQKLPFPGKRGLREAVAGANADAIGFAVAETTNRVLRDLRLAYDDLRLADRTLELTEQAQETLRTLAALATARYALGRATQADALQAATRSAEAQRDLVRIHAERSSAESELRRLTAREDAAPIMPMPAVAPAPFTGDSGDGMARPQLAALHAMESRGELELALAERDYYPDVELRLGYGHRERSLDGLPRDDVVTMTVAVNLPLWRKERLAPRVAEARALRARAAAMAEEQRLETRAGLEQQRARATQAYQTSTLYRSTLLPQARAAAAAARVAWESGAGDFSAVLDATMREYDAALAEATAAVAYDRAAAEIDFLNGTMSATQRTAGVSP